MNIFAQTVPFNINYQGMARDAYGIPIADVVVEATINILQDDTSGLVVFNERHMTTTNAFGIYLIIIGEGDAKDDLQNIDWPKTDYYC